MIKIQPPPRETPATDQDRMWALDVSLAALAGLVLYLVVTRLRFDDPRWLYNAWTYAIAVPLTALILALALRFIASRYIQKSIQLGFLFSVCLHLLLLILAINVVIFSRYFPDAFAGVKPERSPIRHTVPEYLFQTPRETTSTPDWSEPVDAQTASRVLPQEQRQLPPVERTQPRLELPQQRPQRQVPLRQFLIRRRRPSTSQPQPTDSPTRRARQAINNQPSTQPLQSPTAPVVPIASETPAQSVERQVANLQRRQSTSVRSALRSTLASSAPVDVPLRQQPTTPLAQARSRSSEMPTVGESGLTQQRRQRNRESRMQPAGSAPSPLSVAVAALDSTAERQLSPVEFSVTQRGQTTGAQLIAGDLASSMLQSTNQSTTGAELARNNVAARAGVPNVSAGRAEFAPGRVQRLSPGAGFAPAGVPSPPTASSTPANGDGNSGQGADRTEQIADRLGTDDLLAARPSRRGSGSAAANLPEVPSTGPALDLMLDPGVAGFADRVGRSPGVIPAAEQPEVAAMELNPGPRPRRDLGGPAAPAGTEVAAVESFSRRVMRTQGGAPATPAGQVGPETEEAIERGLAYLASIQNEDGSWSLQGHGEEVALRSDTAATGLCLLAFQGAGYTHRQHQYANTVSRGLQFLLDNQRANGDLFRPEDSISNQNVALYSHGIASLALCEAYGMTQDAELRDAAQLSLNYIISTQHRQRGGWRYAPQVSSDTSVSGWMMMSLKSGELSGLEVPRSTYDGIDHWLGMAQSEEGADRYRYNPFAPDTARQRHGQVPTPTMTAVGILMRMYSGWRRDKEEMKSAADYLLSYPPKMGTSRSPQRDAYYWYYATQVMFHMGGDHWEQWNRYLNPLLLESQIQSGPQTGSWDPIRPVPDRWSPHAGRLYVTTMNLLNLEVFYRHLPIYEETAE
ncbi:MAG: hypothetical protein MI861_04205 [Pirellulales bacterium]|nr:hypothetical protein [Pirellulales bacterium]